MSGTASVLPEASARPDARGATAPRVAYVVSRFPRLTETFVVDEIEAVRRAGADVQIHPIHRQQDDVVNAGAAALAVQAHYLPLVSRPILHSQVAELVRSPRRYLGTWWAVLKGNWGSRKLLPPGLALTPKAVHLARRFEREGIEHVHCHFATHPALVGFVVHRLTGIPFSFTAHGSDIHIDRHMLREKVREAAFVAAVTSFNRQVILDECGPDAASKVDVVRCGVDRGRFAAPADRHRDGPLRLCCIGTLHEVKGQRHLVEAIRLLAADGVDVRCTLVGDGEDHDALAARVRDAGLEGAVSLPGPCTHDEVAGHLAASDVLVVPSVPTAEGRREGLPVVILEAMASGIPVVASRLSGIPEIVEDDVTGLLTEPGDAGGLAAAIARLDHDPALCARLVAAASHSLDEHHDLERSARALVERFTHTTAGGVGS